MIKAASPVRGNVVVLTAEETLPLRHRLLRPHQGLEQCRYPGDEAAETRHFGLRVDGSLAGIVSLYQVGCESLNAPDGRHDSWHDRWQLCAMATRPELRHRGLGRRLLEAALAHAWENGAGLVWCNAREEAAGFYQRCGFAVHGQRFHIPDIGPHFLMYCPRRQHNVTG